MAHMNPLRRLRVVSSSAPRDLEAVVADAGRGDEAAFSEFYDLTSSMLYGIVVRVLRDPTMAEEVTQESYIELWRLAPRFDAAKGSAKSWASTVAHRRAVDRVRSEQARRNREEDDGRKAAAPFDQVSETVVDNADRERVRQSLDSLSPSQREAVTLSYYGGHTYREVAALLDVAEGTIKTRIRDGLIKLRDQIGVSP